MMRKYQWEERRNLIIIQKHGGGFEGTSQDQYSLMHKHAQRPMITVQDKDIVQVELTNDRLSYWVRFGERTNIVLQSRRNNSCGGDIFVMSRPPNCEDLSGIVKILYNLPLHFFTFNIMLQKE